MLSEIAQSIIRLYDELASVQFENTNQELIDFRNRIGIEIDELNDVFTELKSVLVKL